MTDIVIYCSKSDQLEAAKFKDAMIRIGKTDRRKDIKLCCYSDEYTFSQGKSQTKYAVQIWLYITENFVSDMKRNKSLTMEIEDLMDKKKTKKIGMLIYTKPKKDFEIPLGIQSIDSLDISLQSWKNDLQKKQYFSGDKELEIRKILHKELCQQAGS